jgi:hypothetical protein
VKLCCCGLICNKKRWDINTAHIPMKRPADMKTKGQNQLKGRMLTKVNESLSQALGMNDWAKKTDFLAFTF